MQTCGVNRREVRMSKVKIKEEGCVEEGEDAEEEAMEEEVVSAKKEVSTTGLGGEEEEEEGEVEGEEEVVAEEVEEIGIETKPSVILFNITLSWWNITFRRRFFLLSADELLTD